MNALEALRNLVIAARRVPAGEEYDGADLDAAISDADAVLAQPEQEPVAWRREWNGDVSDLGAYVYASDEGELDSDGEWQPLYAHPATAVTLPPLRNLSDEEIGAIWRAYATGPRATINDFARALLRAAGVEVKK